MVTFMASAPSWHERHANDTEPTGAVGIVKSESAQAVEGPVSSRPACKMISERQRKAGVRTRLAMAKRAQRRGSADSFAGGNVYGAQIMFGDVDLSHCRPINQSPGRQQKGAHPCAQSSHAKF